MAGQKKAALYEFFDSDEDESGVSGFKAYGSTQAEKPDFFSHSQLTQPGDSLLSQLDYSKATGASSDSVRKGNNVYSVICDKTLKETN